MDKLIHYTGPLKGTTQVHRAEKNLTWCGLKTDYNDIEFSNISDLVTCKKCLKYGRLPQKKMFTIGDFINDVMGYLFNLQSLSERPNLNIKVGEEVYRRMHQHLLMMYPTTKDMPLNYFVNVPFKKESFYPSEYLAVCEGDAPIKFFKLEDE